MENIDINQVPGTGRGGRVTKGDLLSFIKGGHGTSQQGVAPSGSTGGRTGYGYTGPIIAPLEGITEQD